MSARVKNHLRRAENRLRRVSVRFVSRKTASDSAVRQCFRENIHECGTATRDRAGGVYETFGDRIDRSRRRKRFFKFGGFFVRNEAVPAMNDQSLSYRRRGIRHNSYDRIFIPEQFCYLFDFDSRRHRDEHKPVRAFFEYGRDLFDQRGKDLRLDTEKNILAFRRDLCVCARIRPRLF